MKPLKGWVSTVVDMGAKNKLFKYSSFNDLECGKPLIVILNDMVDTYDSRIMCSKECGEGHKEEAMEVYAI